MSSHCAFHKISEHEVLVSCHLQLSVLAINELNPDSVNLILCVGQEVSSDGVEGSVLRADINSVNG